MTETRQGPPERGALVAFGCANRRAWSLRCVAAYSRQYAGDFILAEEDAQFPAPNTSHPVMLPDGTRHSGTVFLSAVIDHPRFEVGDYSYASAHHPPDDWAAYLAPYLYDFSPERLVIGKFCQIADSVRFITASANHRYDGISTFPFAVFGGGGREGRPSFP